jgi:tetratricopeptide (TPR) repeat protein
MSKRDKEKLLKKMEKNFNMNNHRRTLKIANEIIKSYPEEKKAYIKKIISLYNLNKENEALKLSEKIIDLFPNDETLFKTSHYLIDERAYDKSIKICDKLQDEFDDEYMKHLHYSLLYLTRIANAIDFIDKYPKTNSKWKDVYFDKAELYNQEGDYEKSLEVCNELLKEYPYDLNANTKKTFLLDGLERYEERADLLEFRIENNIRKYWALVDKAQNYMENGDIETGMNLLNEVLKSKPNMAYALFIKGFLIYQTDEDIEKALKYLNKSLEANDKRCYKQTLTLKLEILDELERYEEADECRDEFNKLYF